MALQQSKMRSALQTNKARQRLLHWRKRCPTIAMGYRVVLLWRCLTIQGLIGYSTTVSMYLIATRNWDLFQHRYTLAWSPGSGTTLKSAGGQHHRSTNSFAPTTQSAARPRRPTTPTTRFAACDISCAAFYRTSAKRRPPICTAALGWLHHQERSIRSHLRRWTPEMTLPRNLCNL
jgi:hypothetical protein